MKKLRIYLDTSVIGGCFDDEFNEYSNKLFETFLSSINIAIISSTTLSELANAPLKVREKVTEIPQGCYEEIFVSSEMNSLADAYIGEKIVTPKYFDDALHIAIATVLKVDLLVSWNFKHIVNFEKISRFNAVNVREGYGHLEIRTPRDVVEND